ncbi:hypothetical protein HK096_005567, partial [Nowakowskiella sp. JEL0078]
WDSQQLALNIRDGLRKRGLSIWLDLDQMRGNIYEKMAEAIQNSTVITPIITTKYQKSENCNIELSYAKDLRKSLTPIRVLNTDDSRHGWAFAITAGLLYVDFSEVDPKSSLWEEKLDNLVSEIKNRLDKEKATPIETVKIEVNQISEWLDPVDFQSNFEAYQNAYVEGTRLWAISAVVKWLFNSSQKKVLWFNGGAGLGKSVIAWLVCTRLPSGFELAAKFFCRHNDDQKNSASRVVSTLAYQLYDKYPEVFKPHINACMEQDAEDVRNNKLSLIERPVVAFQKLIIDGFKKMPKPKTVLVIVIDALDECGIQGTEIRRDFLEVLYRCCNSLPSFVRIFTTGRPEIDIWTALHGIKSDLLNPQDEENLNDILVFIRHEFNGLNIFDEENLEETCINELAKKADGVFIYARMMCNEIKQRNMLSYSDILYFVREVQQHIDSVYEIALNHAFADGERSLPIFKVVMSCILASAEPLNEVTISKLLGIAKKEVGGIILRIRSLILTENGTITVIHKSLRDFLMSAERCTNPKYYVNEDEAEGLLAYHSIRVINEALQNNGRLVLPAGAEHDPSKLPSQLLYAAEYWYTHIKVASVDYQTKIVSVLTHFCKTRLLNWVELATIIRKLDHISEVPLAVETYLGKISPTYKKEKIEIEELLEDCFRLVTRFRTAIDEDLNQIYTGCLSFCPTQSSIYRHYHTDKLPPTVTVGAAEKWGALLQSFQGHTNSVHCVVYSPDGQTVASSSDDGTIKIWIASSGKCANTLSGHIGAVNSVAFSANGQRLISGSFDHHIKIWDIKSGECLQTFEGHVGNVWSAEFAIGGEFVISGSDDQTSKVWSIETGECIHTCSGHTAGVWAISCSPDKETFASGSFDRSIKIWNIKTGELIKTLTGHTGTIWTVSYSYDGNFLTSGSFDRSVRVWHVETGENLKTFNGHTNTVYCCRFSLDAKYVISASNDATIKIWDMETDKCINTLYGHNGSVWSIALSPNGNTLASGSFDKSVKLWNWKHQGSKTISGDSGSIWAIAASPDGKWIASGANDTYVRLWDVNGKCVDVLTGHTGTIFCTNFSDDSKLLISGSFDHNAILWDVETGELLRTFKGHTGTIWAAVISRDKKTIITGADDSAKIWNLRNGDCLATLDGHKGAVWGCGISPDKKYVATGGDDSIVKVWDTKTYECLKTYTGHTEIVWNTTFSPDGKYLVSSSQDKKIMVWDLQTDECIRTFLGHNGLVFFIRFSHDSKYIVTGSDDSTVKIWDFETAECLNTMTGHTHAVFSVAFLNDGKWAVSGSNDCTVKIWDWKTGDCIRSIGGQDNVSCCVTFSPDQRQVVSVYNGLIQLWDLKTGKCLNSLERKGSPVTSVAFSSNLEYIVTQHARGYSKVLSATTLEPVENPTKYELCKVNGTFDIDGEWIGGGDSEKKKLLWIPFSTDLSAHAFASTKSHVVLGCKSGRIVAVKMV